MKPDPLLGGRAACLAHCPILYLETEKRFETIRGCHVLEQIDAFLGDTCYGLFRVGKDNRIMAVTPAAMGGCTLAGPIGNEQIVNGGTLPAPMVAALR